MEGAARVPKFLPVHYTKDAPRYRLATIDNSQENLEAQYFIREADNAGVLLIIRILRAASRGFKVLLLVDGIKLGGRGAIGRLVNSHPNQEPKVFNPLRVRSSQPALRGPNKDRGYCGSFSRN